MRIDCPNCAAAYDVPASVVAQGRTLRCARCGTQFGPEAASPEVASPQAASAPAASPPAASPLAASPRAAQSAAAIGDAPSGAAASAGPPAAAAVGGPSPPSSEAPPAAWGPDAGVRPSERMALSVEPAPARAPGRPPMLVVAAWLLSLAVLAGGGWAAMAWRAPIMHAWPPSTRLYAALGYAH